MKCYWMLQNAKVTAFTVSELLRENQQGEGVIRNKMIAHTAEKDQVKYFAQN